ncbi:MAG: hypothetical protein LBH06_03225 [Rikenellaceae bacterium]|jgi:hypothetical protein|nr:hypothetical protein [Rikenellaceae bacterium]
MDDFRGYILSGDSSVFPTERQLERIVERYPWFATARAMLAWKGGKDDPLVRIALTGKPLPKLFLKNVAARQTDGTMEVIEQFLEGGEHRIVPDDSASEEDLAAQSTGIPDEELTEELAKIYLAQGHLELAAEIYGKLCLLYPKKSVYFAQIIADLEEQMAGAAVAKEPKRKYK